MSAEVRAPRPWWLISLATVGALALLGTLAVLGTLASDGWRHREPERAQVTTRDRRQTFTVRDAGGLAGTPFVQLRVSALSGARGGSGSSSSDDDDRNIILVDTRTGNTRRLLPDNSRRIVAAEWLTPDLEASPGENGFGELAPRGEAPPRWYVIKLARPDDRGLDILMGDISAGMSKTVLQGVTAADVLAIRDGRSALLLVSTNNAISLRSVDLSTFVPDAAKLIAID